MQTLARLYTTIIARPCKHLQVFTVQLFQGLVRLYKLNIKTLAITNACPQPHPLDHLSLDSCCSCLHLIRLHPRVQRPRSCPSPQSTQLSISILLSTTKLVASLPAEPPQASQSSATRSPAAARHPTSTLLLQPKACARQVHAFPPPSSVA